MAKNEYNHKDEVGFEVKACKFRIMLDSSPFFLELHPGAIAFNTVKDPCF